jgi:hypothetical protein
MLIIVVDEDEDNPVSCKPTEIVSEEIHEERVKAPRGLRKARYYAIELQNLSGADFDLDTMSFVVDPIRRKVR